jgi:probable addiction module antidote protein
MKLHKFDDALYEKLRSPDYAAAYLDAAKEDGIEEFLSALKDVACAQEGGITVVAERTGLGRESMYKSLSKKGNPSVRYVCNVLHALGLELSVTKARTS